MHPEQTVCAPEARAEPGTDVDPALDSFNSIASDLLRNNLSFEGVSSLLFHNETSMDSSQSKEAVQKIPIFDTGTLTQAVRQINADSTLMKGITQYYTMLWPLLIRYAL